MHRRTPDHISKLIGARVSWNSRFALRKHPPTSSGPPIFAPTPTKDGGSQWFPERKG